MKQLTVQLTVLCNCIFDILIVDHFNEIHLS